MTTTIDSDLVNTTIRKARRQQWRHQLLLSFFALMSIGGLAVAAAALLSGKMEPLSYLPALITNILSAVILLRLWRAGQRELAAYRVRTEPSREALAAAAATTRERLRECRLSVALILGAITPTFAIAVYLLVANGKMSNADALSFALLLGCILAVVLSSLNYRIRHELKPRLQSLESLHKQFDD